MNEAHTWALRVLDEMVRILTESTPEQIQAAVRAVNLPEENKADRHLRLQITIGKEAFMYAAQFLRANATETDVLSGRSPDEH